MKTQNVGQMRLELRELRTLICDCDESINSFENARKDENISEDLRAHFRTRINHKICEKNAYLLRVERLKNLLMEKGVVIDGISGVKA